MDEKKMTQEEEKDFIDKAIEATKSGAKKLGKAAAGVVLATGVALGGMTADLPGMSIDEAQAATFDNQPSRVSVNSGVGGGYTGSRSGGNRGGFNVSRGGGYSAPQQIVVNNKTNNVPSTGQVFRNTLAYNGANLLTGFATNLFGLNGYGGLLYDHYGYDYGNLNSWERRNFNLARAAQNDWYRSYNSGRYVTVADGIAGAQQYLQPIIQSDPKLAAKLDQLFIQALENEKKLTSIQKGVDKANEKLDVINTKMDETKAELVKQGKSLQRIEEIQQQAREDAAKYHGTVMGVLDNQQALLQKTSDDVGDMKLYMLALMAAGVVSGAAITYLTRRRFNLMDKKIDGVDKKVGTIGTAVDANFEQLDKLLSEVGIVRDTTDAVHGKVFGDMNGVGSAYERNKARLVAQAEKEKDNGRER